MDNKEFDLSNMSAEDLIRIRAQWRRSMMNLPFEWKIGIVEKLHSISRLENEEKPRDSSENDTAKE